jgi:hypothetical protein
MLPREPFGHEQTVVLDIDPRHIFHNPLRDRAIHFCNSDGAAAVLS